MTPLILAAALSLIAASDVPQTAPTSSTPAANSDKPKDDPDKVICRSQPVTGSRFIKRVCHTRAEWAQMDAQVQEMERQMREHSAITGHASSAMSGQ
jgi:hypothetical protein